jgi:UPF0042 nucleotide-binding protein
MKRELILLTGMSGSGKSVALHALEDNGFYCVDNLPPELLLPFMQLDQQHHEQRVAIAMDVRSAATLPMVPAQLSHLRALNVDVRLLFLDATTDTLVHRYSETRRRHPLSSHEESTTDIKRDLISAIERERELLSVLRDQAHIIDSSLLRSGQLQAYVKSLIAAPAAQLTLMFESFAFKRGIPVHADFVFDVRMLPNPHYESGLRALSGRDSPVGDWLSAHPEVPQMQQHIEGFLDHWLPALVRDHRSYVTVAIGCTGGQHRSVYLVEQLARHYAPAWVTLRRHRELDAQVFA